MYQISGDNILRLSDNTLIPIDPGNVDYRAYLAWLALGYVVHPESPSDSADALAQKKAQRERDVAAITVTTAAGHTFDGDETSQGRMARAILGLQSRGPGATTVWVLANNSPLAVEVTELTEALTLAGVRQTELWIIT
jgi:hypothetical protein